MTEDTTHHVCELERKVAVLEQKSKDDDRALILAKEVSSARWTAIIALFVALINALGTIALLAFRR